MVADNWARPLFFLVYITTRSRILARVPERFYSSPEAQITESQNNRTRFVSSIQGTEILVVVSKTSRWKKMDRKWFVLGRNEYYQKV